MRFLYVISDRPGSGKTTICASLAHLLNNRGINTIVLKPHLNPTELNEDQLTYQQLLNQPNIEWDANDRDGKINADTVKSAANSAGDYSVVIIEGASDITDEDSQTLTDELDASVLVVGKKDSGFRTDAVTSYRDIFDTRLIGFLLNCRPLYQSTDVATTILPEITAADIESLGTIMEDRFLLSVTVGEIANHINGRFIIGKEFETRLIEYFMVGGLGLDSGESYFSLRENKAVIIRGDRPDVQMAALATTTSCMVATNDVEPIEYVVNEAELDEVPIILVRDDTLTTMDSLNSLQQGVRFNHPPKLERFASLMTEHVNLDAIYGALDIDV